MQMTRIATLLIVCASLAFARAEAEPEAEPEAEFKRVMLSDAKLVYGEEIADYTTRLPESSQAPWRKHFPKNVDAIGAGKEFVFGLSLAECRGYSPGTYAPSDCGDAEIIVVSLREIPATGKAVTLESDRLVAAGMFLGSRHGPGRSGCIGFPSHAVIRTVERNGAQVRLSVELRFHLVSHFQYPRSCGERTISGNFDFRMKSTEDIADGGLRHLFD